VPVLTFIAIQVPAVQNYACRRLTDNVNKRINGELSVKRVFVVFFNKIMVEDASLVTADGDTTATIGRANISFPPFFWRHGEIRVSRVILEDGYLKYKKDSAGNNDISGIFGKRSAAKKDTDINSDGGTGKYGCYSLESLQLKNFKVVLGKWNIDDIHLAVKKFRYCNDSISCRITDARGKDSGGLELKGLKAGLCYTPTSICIKSFVANDGHSNIRIDSASLRGTSREYLKNFTHDAHITLHLSDSHISTESAAPFVNSLKGKNIQAVLDCDAEGTFDDLRLNSIMIRTPDEGTFINAEATFLGLSESSTALAHIGISDCSTSIHEIEYILRQAGMEKAASGISKYAQGEKLHFTGSLDGFFNDFVAYGTLSSSDAGKILLDIQMQNDIPKDLVTLNGHAKTEDLDLGILMQSKQIGKLSLESTLNGTIDRKKNGNSILDINKLIVSKLGMHGYDYSNITAAGRLKGKEFTGRVACSDPNLNFLFEGIFTFNGEKANSLYQFAANIGYANLKALNIDRKEKSEIRLHTKANFTKTATGDALGTVDVTDLHLADAETDRNIGDIHIMSSSGESGYHLQLDSKFASASYQGTATFSKFIEDIKRLAERELPNLFGSEETLKDTLSTIGESYKLDFETYDTRDIFAFFLPGIYMGDSTSVHLDVTKDDIATLTAKSSLLSYKNNFLRGFRLSFNNKDSKLTCRISDDMILSGDIPLNNNIVTLTANDNKAKVNVKFSESGEYRNNADITAAVSFLDTAKSPYNYVINIMPSNFDLQGEHWKIENSNISVRNDYYAVDRLLIHSNAQKLNVSGVASASSGDSLEIGMDNFDLSLLNTVLKKLPFRFQGKLSGKAMARSLLKDPTAYMDFSGKKIKIGDDLMGDMVLSTKWENTKNDFDVILGTTLGDRRPLSISGTFKPSDKSVNLGIDMDRFDIGFIAPMVESVFSNFGGSLSGSIGASGPINDIKLNSDMFEADSLLLKIAWTNVQYVIRGPISINDNKVRFEDMVLLDDYGNKGKVSGGVNLGNFSNVNFNTRIDVDDALVLNNNAQINSTFYSRLFASGSCNILGPLNKLILDVKARTENNSTMHIPLGGESRKSHSLLTFIDSSRVAGKTDAFDSLLQHSKQRTGNTSSLEIRINAMATTGTMVLLEINPETGDALKVRGRGNIEIDINDSKDLFDIKGDYKVQEGSYRLAIADIAARDFTIDEGGTIHFGGDIMQSELNLTAKYKTKAPIGVLIGDTTSISTRRNVNCGIAVTGKLANPNLKFSIDIPDLDPTTKGKVESALNTDDKIIKQTLAVLLTGGFIPNEQSGVMDNSTILYSNVTEILANSLNSVFQQLNIPLDLGFTYQPGYNQKDLFDVAVSTTLFNNRVTVSGNIGNKQYSSSTSNSDLAGDIDVQIKLDKNGRIRLSLFSHSADKYTNYLDQTQRNGAGIVYQEEFDNFGELCRKVFWSKKKQEEYIKNHLKEGIQYAPSIK
jgi:hypothetical protein